MLGVQAVYTYTQFILNVEFSTSSREKNDLVTAKIIIDTDNRALFLCRLQSYLLKWQYFFVAFTIFL